MTEMQKLAMYRKAGYTRLVTYTKYLPQYDVCVEESFPTVADAVVLHIKGLKKNSYINPKSIKTIIL